MPGMPMGPPGMMGPKIDPNMVQTTIPPRPSVFSRAGSKSHISARQACCSVSFNQSHDCLILGSQDGFGIYSVGTGNAEIISCLQRDLNGGIAKAEMVNKTNVMALVGGGDSPKWPKNKLIIWDDQKQSVIGELTFQGQIESVKINEEV